MDSVDLDVATGEAVGIVGPNGAGKTCLLNAVSGVLGVESGHVELFGRNVTTWSCARRANFGLVRTYEDAPIWPLLSTRDNVAVAVRRQGLRTARKIADAALERAGLGRHADEAASALSLGERRRLDIARVLARRLAGSRSLVMLLDEPFRGLDAAGREDLVAELRRTLDRDSALVVVDHDHDAVRSLCSRVLLCEAGRLGPLPAVNGLASATASGPRPPTTASTGLVVSGVRARLGGTEVLRGVELSCGLGCAVQVTGRNGAGKTSLLRVLVGTLRTSSGLVRLLGAPVDNDTAVGRGIGYVPQRATLAGGFRVERLLELALGAAHDRTAGEDQASAFLAAFPDVVRLRDRVACDLSAGQRALVAIWIALLTGPVLLLVDEPAAALSPDLAERLYAFLGRNWLRDDRMLICVEHRRLLPWARQVTLDAGRIVADPEAHP
ncbi:MAG: ATP-binding cassette domain-containing protein [Planctomycetes bacterium]|nr:ATP-binding cassette domain-containing protein [Planctomycetota bacterium]